MAAKSSFAKICLDKIISRTRPCNMSFLWFWGSLNRFMEFKMSQNADEWSKSIFSPFLGIFRQNRTFDYFKIWHDVLEGRNEFSDPQNHRKDILQGLVPEIISSRPILAIFHMAAILDFGHFEFSKMVDDVIIERIDPENLTKDTISDRYEEYLRNYWWKTDFYVFYWIFHFVTSDPDFQKVPTVGF